MKNTVGSRFMRILKLLISLFGSLPGLLPQARPSHLLMLVIPIIFVVNSAVMQRNMGLYFMGNTDPEYFYLYNGGVIGGGNLSVQYTAHPGTPLMFLIAVSSRITSFFQPGGYMENLVDDPEKYIGSASLFLALLTAILLFSAGQLACRYTGFLAAGLILQSAVFGSYSLLHLSSRLIPESMLILPFLMLFILILRYIYEDRPQVSVTTYFLAFALITGFGMAIKLSFFPTALIPLVLIRAPLKMHLRYLAGMAVAFAFFAYPVLFNLSRYWEWISGIVTHSGKHGAGSPGFIDLDALPERMMAIFGHDRQLFALMAISLVMVMVTYFFGDRHPDPVSRRLHRAILAVNASIALGILLIIKHFEVYYFMPFYIFKIFLLLLSGLLALSPLRSSGIKHAKSIALSSAALISLFIIITQGMKTAEVNRDFSVRKDRQQEELWQVRNAYDPASPLIISGAYYGTPFVEFAHYNGMQMSFHLKGFYRGYLREKFPLTYHYVDWSDRFNFWDEQVDFGHILRKADRAVYVFTGEGRQGDLEIIIGRARDFLEKDSCVIDTVYQNSVNGDRLYRLSWPKP